MIQQVHFWVYIQKKQNHCLEEESILLCSFTVVKVWKQPTCLLAGEWIKKMWSVSHVLYAQIYTHTYHGISLSLKKKWDAYNDLMWLLEFGAASQASDFLFEIGLRLKFLVTALWYNLHIIHFTHVKFSDCSVFPELGKHHHSYASICISPHYLHWPCESTFYLYGFAYSECSYKWSSVADCFHVA